MFKRLLFISSVLLAGSSTAFGQKDSLHFSLDEVIVTGTRAQVNRNNVPMTISVINRNDIEKSSESALLPVLSERIPGMFVTERGVTGFGVSTGGAGGITMRGVGGSPTTGVLILIDGHPQYMGIMGHHLPDAYVASDVERVEVVRGPASILYGSNAMGGVINIITRKQDQDGWSANGRLMYGSYNTQKYMANGGLKQGKFDAFVSVNHDRTDGHRDNSDFRITNAYARAGYGLSEHFRAWGDVSIASFTAQNPGTTNSPINDNIADIVRGVVSATLENDYGKSNGALKLFYNFGDHEINDGYGVSTNNNTPRDYRFHSTDKNFGAALYQIFRPVAGNEITAGIDFKSYGGRAWNKYEDRTRPDYSMVDTTTYEAAGYVIVQQTLFDKLTVNGGLRLEYNETFGTELIPQIGLAYRPTQEAVIKASVSKGFRSPTIRELYMWGMGNLNLKPERMLNYELSLGHTFIDGRLSAELTGYIADGSNMIAVMPIEGKPTNVNIGEFNNKGVELSLKWYATKNLELQGNYSYLHMDEPVMYAPEQQAFVAASYRLKNWNISANYQYINNMYSATGANPSKSSYGLLNAKISYHPFKSLSFFVTGENLTGKDYEIMAGYPMPGATVLGGINLTLGNH
ncbi:iron complex outermembrane receptor protein [termite gut metagenome]|uniref:Iron complex outermembrane receptor protein n=2 Tax=termite gut metagenome TaxID=433724 RepID=A0A5J4S3E9_9ZZZZ